MAKENDTSNSEIAERQKRIASTTAEIVQYGRSSTLEGATTLDKSLPAVTGVDPHRLNGHTVPHIATPVFDMLSVPRDALLHPARAALLAREQRRVDALTNGSTTEQPAALPPKGDVFRKPSR